MNKTRKYLLVFILILAVNRLFAQISQINFEAIFNGEIVTLDRAYYSETLGDSVTFETFKFYVSNPVFSNGEIQYHANDSHYLVDFSDESSTQIDINTPNTELPLNLSFSIGVDSLENVSGAMGGALDPMNGMYWTWKNGYINLKLEGKSKACNNRDNSFIFHLGGYQYPYKCIRHFQTEVDLAGNYSVIIDLEALIAYADIQNAAHIMSPNDRSMQMATALTKYISVEP